MMRQQAAEDEELELALARSLGGGSDPGASEAPRAPGPSTALLEEMLPSMPFNEARGFLLVSDDAPRDDGKKKLRGRPAPRQPAYECAVCLAEVEGAELVRVLPCVHVFHASCIDKWFSRVAACPTCKQTWRWDDDDAAAYCRRSDLRRG